MIRRPQRHLAAVPAGGDLLASYLSTWLGTSAARPGENFDAHPQRQAPPAAEHLTMFIRKGSYFSPSKHAVHSVVQSELEICSTKMGNVLVAKPNLYGFISTKKKKKGMLKQLATSRCQQKKEAHMRHCTIRVFPL